MTIKRGRFLPLFLFYCKTYLQAGKTKHLLEENISFYRKKTCQLIYLVETML